MVAHRTETDGGPLHLVDATGKALSEWEPFVVTGRP